MPPRRMILRFRGEQLTTIPLRAADHEDEEAPTPAMPPADSASRGAHVGAPSSVPGRGGMGEAGHEDEEAPPAILRAERPSRGAHVGAPSSAPSSVPCREDIGEEGHEDEEVPTLVIPLAESLSHDAHVGAPSSVPRHGGMDPVPAAPRRDGPSLPSSGQDPDVSAEAGKHSTDNAPARSTGPNPEVAPQVSKLFSVYNNMWSERVDRATSSFSTSLKELSDRLLSSDEVDKTANDLSVALKESHNELSSTLMTELSALLPVLAAKQGTNSLGVKRIALLYDKRMLQHVSPANPKHYECPERLTSIMDKLRKEKLLKRCAVVPCDRATTDALLAVHKSQHIEDLMSLSALDQTARNALAFKHDANLDVYFNRDSGEAALFAAGGVIKACRLVAEGIYEHSFAVVRPPGHHASRSGAKGFCLLNNVAIGATFLLDNYKKQRILIVDWDVHHGDGTQKIFYKDKRVLCFSVHRYESGFYPGTDFGGLNELGDGDGAGYNVNICWKHKGMRDVDYVTVWDHVLIPLIEEFKPEMILISAGFDADAGRINSIQTLWIAWGPKKKLCWQSTKSLEDFIF